MIIILFHLLQNGQIVEQQHWIWVELTDIDWDV